MAANISLADCSLSADDSDTNFNFSTEFDEIQKHPRTVIINKLMELYTKHKMPEALLEQIAMLINLVPGSSSTKIPTKASYLIKEFQQNNKYSVTKSLLCGSCEQYTECDNLRKVDIKCGNVICEKLVSMNNPYILNIGIEQQLRSVILRNYKEIDEFQVKIIEYSDKEVTDVYSGKVLKNIIEKNDDFVYSLCLNTDGAKIYNSGNESLWPVMLCCNFLPVDIRFKKENLLLVALYFGSTKPDFVQYFNLVADEMHRLTKHGMTVNSRNYKFSITHGSMDLPARASVQQIKQFNGYFSCIYCEKKGEKTSKGIRYTKSSTESKLREHKKVKAVMKRNIGKSVWIKEKGIKGLSAMAAFKNYDLVKSFWNDYMHQALEGVCKKLLKLYLSASSHGKGYYISPFQQRKLNRRLLGIRPCRFISRKPRSLKYLKYWTASELRNMLLFYYPIFEDILSEEYFKHFQLFAKSIFKLLQPSITHEELNIVEDDLKKFVADFQDFFGKENMTMNIHSTLHLAQSVRDNGMLSVQSMFCFEMMNGQLKRYVVGQHDPMQQIVCKYLIDHNKYKPSEKKINNPQSYCKLKYQLTTEEKHLFQKSNIGLDEDNVEIYSAYKNSKNVIFTSLKYTRARKTVDYFVKTVDDKLGKVKFFVKINENVFAVIDEYEIIDDDDSIGHLLKVTAKQTIYFCEINDLDKLMYIQFGFHHYATSRPNNFEVN